MENREAALLKNEFLLKKDSTFLNFGSFGACARPVFERYQRYQLELEEEPVHFMMDKASGYLKRSREALANYINCAADDVVYVTNPSYGVNIIAKSFPLQPGDEVLTSNLEYGACDRAWDYYCKKKGATYRPLPIRLPLESKDDFINQFAAGIHPKTKLIFLSHITSATALRFPIEEVCSLAKQKGIPVFIDGAHAPGQVPINLATLGADMYTGACHKWMMTPKGSSFLYVSKAWQHYFDPLLISWGYEAVAASASRFLDYHEMQGTRDLSAFLTIPDAIEFMQKNNWPQVSRYCRDMVKQNAGRFCELLQTKPLAPLTDDFIAQMLSLEIKTANAMELHDILFRQYKIQVPIMQLGNRSFLRFSIQGFNTRQDLDKLYDAVKDLISKGLIIT